MTFLRIFLFNLLFYTLVPLYCMVNVWMLLLPQRFFKYTIQSLFYMIYGLEKYVLGLDFDVKGLENLPKEGSYIIASKHQSAWETFKFQLFTDYPSYVLKYELFFLPFFGWLAWKGDPIPVKRNKGGASIKFMLRKAAQIKADGRPIVIFPQGTRTAPGTKNTYKIGAASLYDHLKVPVVPVALNSGVFWGRNSLSKYPGRVTVQLLPPIQPGLSKREFLKKLEEVIEPVTHQLEEDAKTKYFKALS